MKQNNQQIYQPDFVKDLFNKMSNSYERMNYITSFGFSIRWRKQSLNNFAKTNKKVKVLDLMCGMGETWDFIKNKFPNAEITALDFSDEMLKNAQLKNQKKFNNSIKIINEDFLLNNLKSEYYDYIVCAYGLKTFSDEQIDFLAKETKRILKKGGKFSFIEVSEPNSKLLFFFYQLYLKNIIPILGKLFLGNPEQYKMLWEYTKKFGNSKNAQKMFSESNLENRYVEYFYGCATGIIGIKN